MEIYGVLLAGPGGGADSRLDLGGSGLILGSTEVALLASDNSLCEISFL